MPKITPSARIRNPRAEFRKDLSPSIELKAGAFYPGTPHTYSIYVPAQYDAAKPTPFMIFLDGNVFLIDKVRVPRRFRQPHRKT